MKRDWKKEEKDIYLPKAKPVPVTVPRYRFFTIEGSGNPNDEPFSQAIGALYSLTWTIRMMHKSGNVPAGHYEYSVHPLEAVWDGADDWNGSAPLDKSRLTYRVMIRQPDFVTEEIFQWALAECRVKKPSPYLDKVSLAEMEDGLSVQLMHHGPYDDEPASFALMDDFLEESGLTRRGHTHREIYHGNPLKQAPDKLRTVLRYFVK